MSSRSGVECPGCDGKGRAAAPPTWMPVECDRCSGTGQVPAGSVTAEYPAVGQKAWRKKSGPSWASYAWPTPLDWNVSTYYVEVEAVPSISGDGPKVRDRGYGDTFEECLEAALDEAADEVRLVGSIVEFRWLGLLRGALVFEYTRAEFP